MVDVDDDPLTLVPSRHNVWVEEFINERDRLHELLTQHSLWYAVERIHHVGSTAVSDLAAKDIVDIDIVVADEEVFEIARTIETELGGTRVENSPDWQPIFREVEGQRLNDHVFAHSSDGWKVSVVTRDVLRANPNLCREYERLKRQLANEYGDLEAYSVGKTSFMEQLLSIARADEDFEYEFTIPHPDWGGVPTSRQ